MKRSRLEIIRDILKIIQERKNKIKPTPLLRYSNLSSQRFSQYIDELLKKGFIVQRAEKGRKFFSVTEKGFVYLERYKDIIGFVDDFGL